jgi:hypothetical protein
MHTAPFRARALDGGFDLDPDLPLPEFRYCHGTLAGLHVLRHVERFLASLRMELVINGEADDQLDWSLGGDYYDGDVAASEFRRYRRASSPGTLRRLLRHEPHRVPLLHMAGTSCVGWNTVSWETVRLDRQLRPGQLFLLLPSFAHMSFAANGPHHLHLMAWQAPFPTHSLVSWTDNAELCDEPQALDEGLRQIAGYMFHAGQPAPRGADSSGRVAWWRDASARTSRICDLPSGSPNEARTR